MKDIIHGLWKWIFWIAIILLVGAGILAFRIFVIDKNYDGTAASLNPDFREDSEYNSNYDSNSNAVTDTVVSEDSNGSGALGSIGNVGKKIVNGAKALGNATVRGYKEDEEKYDYNKYNFDEAFLMYEGTQSEGKVKNVLEHLISNANGNFYDRTSVTAVNFGNNAKIDFNGDIAQYQNSIKELENSVVDGEYDISFKYGAVHTYVNEIVITKK